MRRERRWWRPPRSAAERRYLLRGEVIHRDRIFEQRIIPRHYRDATVGDEIAQAVGFGVEADGRSFRQMHIAINDRILNAAVAADADMREQDAFVDFRIRVDP